jgi:protein O-GlcNAc transferase
MAPIDAKQLVDEGNALMRLGRHEAALAKYQGALKLVPGHPGVLNNCAVVLEKLNRLEEAFASYEQVHRAAPKHPGILNNCGVVLNKLNRLEAALDHFDRALAHKPDYAEAFNNRGNVLLKLHRAPDALESYERALALRPDHPDTLHNRATAFQQMKRYDEAVASLVRALELAPDLWEARERLFHNRMNCCDWTDHDAASDAIIAEIERGRITCNPFLFLGIARSPATQMKCAKTYAASLYSGASNPSANPRRKDGPIHVAYVSADFRQHAVAHLTASLFEEHDRKRFEVTGISLGPDDRSAVRGRLQGAFDQFIDARTKSDSEVASLMRQLQIDIAVDLNGYTEGHRTPIFARRVAPIQVSHLGYSGTMGTPFIDYIIADDRLIPAALEAHYSEHVVRLPDCFMPCDRNRPGPGDKPSRNAVGLPDDAFVFCAFSSSFKIRPDIFGLWMRLLKNIDGSVLWLREENARATANLRREAEGHGVAPERLIFAPHVPIGLHLARHQQADLFLDTFPYGAHTTANDALWAGLPVVTLCGDTFASRVGASLLHAVRLPELIATSHDHYEALALELARTPTLLGSLRARLERQRFESPLFDTGRYAHHLEQAYITMYERHRKGEPPQTFNVEPIREQA